MKCKYSTKHTRDTPVPQNYCEHAKVAIGKSAKLIWFGLAGIVHGFLPEIRGPQFYTSTQVLKAAKFLMYSGRHDKEITAIFGSDVTTLIAFKRGLGTYKPGDGEIVKFKSVNLDWSGSTWVNVEYPKPTPLWHHDAD